MARDWNQRHRGGVVTEFETKSDACNGSKQRASSCFPLLEPLVTAWGILDRNKGLFHSRSLLGAPGRNSANLRRPILHTGGRCRHEKVQVGSLDCRNLWDLVQFPGRVSGGPELGSVSRSCVRGAGTVS